MPFNPEQDPIQHWITQGNVNALRAWHHRFFQTIGFKGHEWVEEALRQDSMGVQTLIQAGFDVLPKDPGPISSQTQEVFLQTNPKTLLWVFENAPLHGLSHTPDILASFLFWHHATTHDTYLKMFNVLLDKGANPNLKTGKSALEVAVLLDNKPAILSMVDHGLILEDGWFEVSHPKIYLEVKSALEKTCLEQSLVHPGLSFKSRI